MFQTGCYREFGVLTFHSELGLVHIYLTDYSRDSQFQSANYKGRDLETCWDCWDCVMQTYILIECKQVKSIQFYSKITGSIRFDFLFFLFAQIQNSTKMIETERKENGFSSPWGRKYLVWNGNISIKNR